MLVAAAIISTTEFKFLERTSTSCTTDGQTKVIAGYQSGEKTLIQCKLDCEKYEWCRGIRVANPDESTLETCRLLTNHSVHITGWKYYNIGNWAEPRNWADSQYNTLRCLEKIKISMM